MDENEAWRQFARAQAAAYSALATNLPSKSVEPTPPIPHNGTPDPTREYSLGKRQIEVVRLSKMAMKVGLKTSEIAKSIDASFQNTRSALIGLERRGIVELVPGQTPSRFRLVPRYRSDAD